MWTENAAIQVGFATKVGSYLFVRTNTRELKKFEIRVEMGMCGPKREK
jgi:hypothetical protein